MQQQETGKSPHKNHRSKLVRFLNDMPTPAQGAFAADCGTTIGHLRQVAYGNRECRAEMAILIDKHSKGAVPMEYMAPSVDWTHVRISLTRRKRDGAES